MNDFTFVCRGCAHSEDGQWYCGAVGIDGICSRCGGLAQSVYRPEVNEPRFRFGPWPISVTTLAVHRPIVWDVNGYYRAFGLRPGASRREVRVAYMAMEGWRYQRLTTYAKVLLNPVLKARYDAVPLGQIYFDKYVAEEFERRVAQEVLDHLGAGGADEFIQPFELPKDLLDNAFDILGQTDSTLDAASGLVQNPSRFGWVRWTWRSDPRKEDEDGLRLWQAMICSALVERGEAARFAVGYHGFEQPWRLMIDQAGRPVFFLRADRCSKTDLAAWAGEAADQWVRESSRQLSGVRA